MKVFLVHHANTVAAADNPERPLSDLGRAQADRIGAHLKTAGIAPRRILHSDKLWTRQTAERVAAALGSPDIAALAAYPIGSEASLSPFLSEINAGGGDIVMTGHSEFLRRAASRLLCGDESAHVIEYKPGHGALFCLEGAGVDWVVAYALRQEHMGA